MKKINQQISQYIDWCKTVADMTEQTIISKEYILYRFAKQTRISDMSEFTNEIFNNWKYGMLSGKLTGKIHKPSSCNIRIKTIRAFVRWLKDCDICNVPVKPPFLSTVRQAEEKNYTFYNREQIELVLSKADITEKAMICLMFESGLRLTEFQNIKLEDIDFDNNSIYVVGKGRKHAKVFFTSECSHYLINYINEKGLMFGYLWQSVRNDYYPYTRDALRCKMRVAFERVGFCGFTPHQLRHSFATDLIESGATIYEAQKLLRHSSSKTTETYIHNLQNTLSDVYSRLKNQGIYHKDSIYWSYKDNFKNQEVYYKENQR